MHNNGAADDEVELENIEREIDEAETQGDKKVSGLLKKIKQYFEVRQHATTDKERQSFDTMIHEVRKQIDELAQQPIRKSTLGKKNMFDMSRESKNYKNLDLQAESPNYDEDDMYGMQNKKGKYGQQSPDMYGNDMYNDGDDLYNVNQEVANQYNRPGEYSQDDQYYEDPRQNVRDSMESHKQSQFDNYKQASMRNDGKIGKNQKSANSPSPNREIEKRLDDEPQESIQERRDKGIKEIFDFYTRQHLMIGKKATFEQIEYELSNLNMGEFMKFCKDFNIPVSKTR